MPQLKQEFTRCAVCKIDLKGKFVFIDDQIEQLLGYSKIDLYGKPLHDFLDSNSVLLLDDILNVRNNYETFYDATILHFINKQNKVLCLKVVMTLNFIAGNPVNFQLIIDSDNIKNKPEIPYSVSEQETLAIISKLNADTLADTNLLIQFFHSLSKSENVVLYCVGESQLDLVATSETSEIEEVLEKTLAKTNQIHFDYAESGQTYSFLNEKDVSHAIEKYKKAPNEFLLPLNLSGGVQCLLRMNYPDDYKISKLERIYRKLLIATSIVEKILTTQNSIAEPTDSVDIQFTIGFLESIHIPAFLTDSEGDIVGYNPSMRKFFPEKILNGSYYKLFKSILKFNKEPFIDSISDYVNSAFDNFQSSEKQFQLKLNKTDSKQLTILKIGDTETDRSACFVFVTKQ